MKTVIVDTAGTFVLQYTCMKVIHVCKMLQCEQLGQHKYEYHMDIKTKVLFKWATLPCDSDQKVSMKTTYMQTVHLSQATLYIDAKYNIIDVVIVVVRLWHMVETSSEAFPFSVGKMHVVCGNQ